MLPCCCLRRSCMFQPHPRCLGANLPLTPRRGIVQAVWVYGCNPVQRWRYRHIPGPRPAWMLGNAVTMRRKMAHVAYEDYMAVYGPVFRIFIGMQPFVVISGEALHRASATSPVCQAAEPNAICHHTDPQVGRSLRSTAATA